MDKQNVLHTHNEILFGHKKKEILTHATIWMNFEDMMPRETSQSQKTNTYNSTYLQYLEQANSQKQKVG